MKKTDFKELGRIKTTDASSIVLSEMHRNGNLDGYLVNKYIVTEKYTGFGAGGVTIPEERIVEFLKLFPKDLLKDALEGK